MHGTHRSHKCASDTVWVIDSFVYMVSSDMIGPDKTKTNSFGREGLTLPILQCEEITVKNSHEIARKIRFC